MRSNCSSQRKMRTKKRRKRCGTELWEGLAPTNFKLGCRVLTTDLLGLSFIGKSIGKRRYALPLQILKIQAFSPLLSSDSDSVIFKVRILVALLKELRDRFLFLSRCYLQMQCAISFFSQCFYFVHKSNNNLISLKCYCFLLFHSPDFVHKSNNNLTSLEYYCLLLFHSSDLDHKSNNFHISQTGRRFFCLVC